jgi:hypothetical protein
VNLLGKILVLLGSTASIGFGIWHFWVPKVWKWYSFIDPAATELIIAVRAINVFFSLSLILFGALNILFIFGNSDRYSILVLLSASCVLWLTRLTLQIIYPQGSINPVLQYGMLCAFVTITLSYAVSLWMIVSQKLIV